jgi:hypothetical protein
MRAIALGTLAVASAQMPDLPSNPLVPRPASSGVQYAAPTVLPVVPPMTEAQATVAAAATPLSIGTAFDKGDDSLYDSPTNDN